MVYQTIRRFFHQASLGDQSYRFLFKKPPPDEFVAFDCETTGLDIAKDDIVAIAAVLIKGNRIEASRHFQALVKPEAPIKSEAMKIHHLREADVERALPVRKILDEFLHFIGPRPLVGYYLDFDVNMIDKHVLPFIQIGLPNKRIDVSSLYYDRKYGNAPPGTTIDLRFVSILQDLGIPDLGQHEALSDALMTAMMFLILSDLKKRGVYLPRERTRPHHHVMGGA